MFKTNEKDGYLNMHRFEMQQINMSPKPDADEPEDINLSRFARESNAALRRPSKDLDVQPRDRAATGKAQVYSDVSRFTGFSAPHGPNQEK